MSLVELKEPLEFLNGIKYFDMPLDHRVWIAKSASPIMVRHLKEAEQDQEVNAEIYHESFLYDL